MTNWLHDYFYDAGFVEAAGNAQALNFGREEDALVAQSNDYSRFNNANMSTPRDGDRDVHAYPLSVESFVPDALVDTLGVDAEWLGALIERTCAWSNLYRLRR